MVNRITILLLLFFQQYTLQAQTTITMGATIVEVDTVATGLDIPWEILWGPDNQIWVTEREGIVSRIDPINNVKDEILDIKGIVYQQSESGLLGMAIHPDFSTTPEVFLVYTYLASSSSIKERLVKYTYNGSKLTNPQILLDSIAGNTTHDGSRLLFLPDTTLLMTTGDAQNTSFSQDMSSLNGKVLRINPDGSIPNDNPFPNSFIYSFGHRNAQGLCFGPNNMIYLSEHGPTTDDEFQLLFSGKNYGWPNVHGFCDSPNEITFCTTENIQEPIRSWTPTIAVSDIIYYENSSFPELDSSIILTVLKDKKIAALKLDNTGEIIKSEEDYLTNMFGRLRDICVGSNKEIYLATNGSLWTNTQPNTHTIIRLTPPKVVTSIELEKEMPIVSFFPSPFINELNIHFSYELQKNTTLKIIDITGRIYYQKNVGGSDIQLNLFWLEAGIYFIEGESNGKILFHNKIVKR